MDGQPPTTRIASYRFAVFSMVITPNSDFVVRALPRIRREALSQTTEHRGDPSALIDDA
jgi:hypothetical protein